MAAKTGCRRELMIRLTRQAARQLSDLRRHYEALDRIEAVRNLTAVIRQAAEQIEQSVSETVSFYALFNG